MFEKVDSKILPLNVVSAINKKTDVVSLVVSSVDALYYYILPLLDNSKMYKYKVYTFFFRSRSPKGRDPLIQN